MSLQFDRRDDSGIWGRVESNEVVFLVGSCFGEFNYCNCIITFEP